MSAPVDRRIAALQSLQSGLTKVLVAVAVVALAFTATNVTLFAIDHHISVWIAWLLDPMVAVALGAVLIVDGRLSEHGVQPSGWATGLRWFSRPGNVADELLGLALAHAAPSSGFPVRSTRPVSSSTPSPGPPDRSGRGDHVLPARDP